MVRLNRALEGFLVKAIQDPKMAVRGDGGGNVQICIQVIGKDAVDAAISPDGDIRTAMNFILDRLEEPKIEKLQTLAFLCAFERCKNKRAAARFLGVCERIIYDRNSPWSQRVEAMQREAIEVLEDDESDESPCVGEPASERVHSDKEDPRELPR